MRFPKKFTRQLGAVTTDPLLGSDVDPSTLATPATEQYLADTAGNNNVLTCRPIDLNTNPVQRIAVGYRYTGVGPAIDLAAKVYLYEEKTQQWYLLASMTLKNKAIVWADCIALVDEPQTGSGGSRGPGALEMALVVSAVGAPNGVYDFVMGGDISVTV